MFVVPEDSVSACLAPGIWKEHRCCRHGCGRKASSSQDEQEEPGQHTLGKDTPTLASFLQLNPAPNVSNTFPNSATHLQPSLQHVSLWRVSCSNHPSCCLGTSSPLVLQMKTTNPTFGTLGALCLDTTDSAILSAGSN